MVQHKFFCVVCKCSVKQTVRGEFVSPDDERYNAAWANTQRRDATPAGVWAQSRGWIHLGHNGVCRDCEDCSLIHRTKITRLLTQEDLAGLPYVEKCVYCRPTKRFLVVDIQRILHAKFGLCATKVSPYFIDVSEQQRKKTKSRNAIVTAEDLTFLPCAAALKSDKAVIIVS